MENIIQQSVASLVLKNHQIVPVLEKYNIDYCCRGKGSLADACKERGIDLPTVLSELEAVQQPGACCVTMPFTEMSQAQLINHIVVRHHYYVKNAMPQIMNHLEKVVTKHGVHYPFMIEVKAIFEGVQMEMDLHMQKEELVLFPKIVQAEKEQAADPQTAFAKKGLSAPILMMEREHEHAGDAMFQIRKLTDNYAVPAGACTTFQVCLAELKDFENDLHQHVHLENNILFPRALQMGLPV